MPWKLYISSALRSWRIASLKSILSYLDFCLDPQGMWATGLWFLDFMRLGL